MRWPAVNLRRTLLIAQRDYVGYVKTWGFWLSFFLPFILGGILLLVTAHGINVSPVRYETILDETGQHGAAIEARHARHSAQEVELLARNILGSLSDNSEAREIERIIDKDGLDAAQAKIEQDFPIIASQINRAETVAQKMVLVPTPADDIDALKPYLLGEATLNYEGKPIKLNGVIHIYRTDRLQGEYWSPNFNNPVAQTLAAEYFKDLASQNYLAQGGLNPQDLEEARRNSVIIKSFDPSKAAGADEDGQAVTLADRVPYFVAFALALFLWMSVFSGSYMLLTSMLEEKMNKLLEMMLATTRFSEIIFGKLLGIAALTFTATLPYILMGLAGIIGVVAFGDSALGEGIVSAFTPRLLGFFAVFLVLGYVFYGSLFIALGAMSESMQDAQTLTTPIMFILMGCMFVIPLGLTTPDSPILIFASLFPLSAPFAMIVRLPADPPLWQLMVSVGALLIVTLGVIALSGRMFRYGVLSGTGAKGLTDWVKRTILRRKTN